ncbi:MAG: glycosyltransferase family 2 protein [candidate division Zixibacteria bacterium]|nr:glycosyltransferase family 2 protein [candidate division Zixibacteria bacterium]
MNNSLDKTIILIPAFNAALHLEELLTRIKNIDPTIDILVINDGSTDKTAAIVESQNYQNCTILTNKTNRGKGYSLKRGFAYAFDNNYDYLITIDADLQHCPEEITQFAIKKNKGHICIGSRDLSMSKMPIGRWLSNNLTSFMVSIFGGKVIKDSQSGFRMFDLKVLKKMKADSNKFDFESELLFQTGLLNINVDDVPIDTIYKNENSSISHFGDTFRFIKQIWRRIML